MVNYKDLKCLMYAETSYVFLSRLLRFVLIFTFPGWHHAPNRRAMGRHLPFYELIELLHREAKSVATQIRLVSNQRLTRIQGRAYRQLQSKVFGFWQKYENGEKNSGPIIEIDVEIKRRIIA